MSTQAVIVSEGHRFYWPDGSPCYEVPSADGRKMVRPTIAHARKGVVRPSVTTALRETLANTQLGSWKEKNAADAMLTIVQSQRWDFSFPLSEKHVNEIREDWGTEMERRSLAVTDPGKDIHAGVEMGFRGETVPPEFVGWFETVRRVLGDEYPGYTWYPEHTIPTDKGYGGCCDLFGATSGGSHATIDLKTRDKLYLKGKPVAFTVEMLEAGASLRPYDSEPIQLGGYGLALDCFNLANLYLSRSDPAAHVFRRYSPEEAAAAVLNFEDLFRVFCRMKGLK